jgi:hypothetical protein
LDDSPIYEPHVAQLSELLRGADPLVVVPEPDDEWMRVVLLRALESEASPAIESVNAAGLWTTITRERVSVPRTASVEAFLDQHLPFLGSRPLRLWLRLPGDGLMAPPVAARLAEAAATVRRTRSGARILVSGADVMVPRALEHVARTEPLERPRREGDVARNFVVGVLAHLRHTAIDEEVLDLIVRRVQGLEASAVRRLLERAVEAPERGDLVRRIGLERNRLMQGGVLEVREVASDVAANLGGLGVLKRYLEDVRDLFTALAESKHERRHLEALIPKGVLLVGLPGCGKSLSAEVAASMLSLPLLQLHMGRLMDRYLGASESRLDAALAAATAAAPCVLWIDELEKAVGGLGGSEGGGTGGRMLGRLLGWMQDNRRGVFVIATANKLDHVPPELLRRGRFDDHFVVGLPNADERAEILAKHLPEPEWTPTTRVALARDLKDYSGADLVALVREAQRRCWLDTQHQTPTRKHLDNVRADGFKPQAEQWKSDFDAMRKGLEQRGFRSASDVEGKPAPTRVKRPALTSTLPSQLLDLLEAADEQLFQFKIDGSELS